MAIYESKYTRTQIEEGIGAGYVPTLNSAPTASTLTYTRADLPSGSQTVSFVVGQFARVAVTGGYDFYQLKNISSNTATWEKVVSTDTNTIPQGYCDTAANTRDKVVTCTDYVATTNSYIMILMKNANSYSTNNSTIRLNINGTGNKTVYINGTSSSSSSNKILPSGSYLVFYDGTNYYFRTDGKITGNITGDAATVNGKTVGVNVPSNAVFTDTTYSVMGASGSGHASGLVPDTPSTAGTTKFLREDGTWQIPESEGSVIPVVLLSEPSTPEIGMVMFDAGETNKFYQYFRGSWVEISTPHKAIGVGNNDYMYEIIDGVLSLPPIADLEYNTWYIYYTGGPRYQIGQVVFIDEYSSGGILPTYMDVDYWNNKQDAITFNSTYDATTNPAATMADVSGKEDKMSITTKSSGTTLSAALNTYYRCTYNVGTLAVTLPTVSETTKVQSVVLYMTFGTSPNLSISAPSGVSVYFHETYNIEASGTYEINCLYNGAAWIVASTKITVS